MTEKSGPINQEIPKGYRLLMDAHYQEKEAAMAVDSPQAEQEHGDRPEPQNVGEAMRRMNRTLPQILETCDLILHHPELEYDQGDHVTIEYDTAYDLASAFYAVVGVANRQERAIRHALSLHGPLHPAGQVLKEALPDA